MTTWLWPCGATLTTGGPIPHPDGLYAVPEELYERRADAGDFDSILEPIGAHRCSRYGRLWVWWDGWEAMPTVYARERR
jgi:hypothetical protein